jgi:phosphonate transport system substrate-binding protein
MLPVHADITEPITIGVHPFLPATTLIERFSPLAHYLSDRLQRPVRISVSSDYEEHIRATGEGQFDIAFLGPAPYVKVVEQYGPQRLLARMELNDSPSYRGAIVTRAGSPIRSLEQLKGCRFAFGDSNSTMSYLVPEWMLKSAGVQLTDLKQHSHLSNHNDTALPHKVPLLRKVRYI